MAGAAVGQHPLDLGWESPAIDGDDDPAGQHRAQEADRPLGAVAHQQCHAVAGSQTGRQQRCRDRLRGADHAGIGAVILVIDDEFAVAVRTIESEDVADRLGADEPVSDRYAVDLDGLDREAGIGCHLLMNARHRADRLHRRGCTNDGHRDAFSTKARHGRAQSAIAGIISLSRTAHGFLPCACSASISDQIKVSIVFLVKIRNERGGPRFDSGPAALDAMEAESFDRSHQAVHRQILDAWHPFCEPDQHA